MYRQVIVKVRKGQMMDFLNSLDAQTLAEYWLIHCELNKYELDSCFELEEMVPTIEGQPEEFGIDINYDAIDSFDASYEDIVDEIEFLLAEMKI